MENDYYDEYQKRIFDALTRHHQRELDKYEKLNPNRKKRKHTKPEKEVEKACLELMRSWGWSVDIFEAKATWSTVAQVWKQQGMKKGVADCMGSTDHGVGVAVEFKALGKLASFNLPERASQKKFIIEKIDANNFACVVDSHYRLKDIHAEWVRRRAISLASAREYLISMLPKERKKTDDNEPF